MLSRRPTPRHNRGRVSSVAMQSAIQIFGEANFAEFMCGDCGFDPNTGNWTGSVNGHVFEPNGTPLFNPALLNGHGGWSWERANSQRHTCTTLDLPAPPYTIIGVVRQDDWDSNATLVGNSAGINSGNRILQLTSEPSLGMNNGSSVNANDTLEVGEWGVVIAEYTNSIADTLTVASVPITGASSGAADPGAGVQLAAVANAAHWSGSAVEWLFLIGLHPTKHAAYRRRVTAIYGSSVRV